MAGCSGEGALRLMLMLILFSSGTCIINSGLYMTNGTDILYSSDFANTRSVFHQPGGRIVALTYHFDSALLFWSDVEWMTRGIYKGHITTDGSVENVEVIIDKDIMDVNGMTIDPGADHIYWTDGLKRSIELADFNGRNRLVLDIPGLFRPRGIYYDNAQMKLFWNDQGTKKIEMSNSAGGERLTLVDEGVDWPNQMQYYDGKLFWVDSLSKNLMSYSLARRTATPVTALQRFTPDSNIFGLAIIDNIAFVSTWNNGNVVRIDLATRNTELRFTDLSTEAMFSIAAISPQASGNSPCSQDRPLCDICLPLFQHIQCACPSFGAKVLVNGRCVDADNIVLYADAGEGYVGFYSNQPNADNSFRYMVGRSVRPVAVAYDPIQQMVYWSDVHERAIHRAHLNGSNQSIFLSYNHSLGIVDGLAIDMKGRRLYYTNMGTVEIEEASYSWHKIESVGLMDPHGDRRTIVNNVDKPRALAIEGNYLYYTDWGSNARVMRVDLDGNNQEVIGTGLDNPNGIVVIDQAVIVTDSHHRTRKDSNSPDQQARNGTLHFYAHQGATWTESVEPITGEIPFGIAFERRSVSQVTLSIGIWGGVIVQKNVTIEGGRFEVTRTTRVLNVTTPMGLLAVNLASDSGVEEAVCQVSSCEDDQVCLVDNSGSAECSCNSYDPNTDHESVCSIPDNFLLISDFNSIKLVPLEGTDRAVYSIVQTGGYFSNIASLTFHDDTNTVYFSDANKQAIFSYNLNTFRLKLVYALSGVLDGMTIRDDRLYWTNTLQHKIESVNLSGDNSTYQELASGRANPRAIQALADGILWTEWGASPGVFRRDSQGAVRPLVTSNLQWPNALVTDRASNIMYIGDGRTKLVKRCSMTGDSCTPISSLSNIAEHIYDIQVLNQFVYMSDWKSGRVILGVMEGAPIMHTVARDLMRPSQLYLRYTAPVSDCPSNHDCSDLCRPIPGGFVCQCLTGRYLGADGKTCQDTISPFVRSLEDQCSPSCNFPRTCSYDVAQNTRRCLCEAGFGGQDCHACPTNSFKSVVGSQNCSRCEGSTAANNGTQCDCSGYKFWDWKRMTCVAGGSEKPGRCRGVPSPPRAKRTSPPQVCNDDDDCEGARKCCGGDCFDPIGLDECVVDGIVHYVGEIFNPDPCTTCQCLSDKTYADVRYGGAVCRSTECPTLNCPAGLLETPPGQCCPRCSTAGSLWFTNCPSDPVTIALQPDADYAFYEFTPQYENIGAQQPNMSRSPPGNRILWSNNLPQKVIYTLAIPGETVSCKINLFVVDTQPPKITCPMDQTYATPNDSLAVQLPSPAFSDNVGIDGSFESTIGWNQDVAVGRHSVQYSVRDTSSNNAVCSFHFDVTRTRPILDCSLPPHIDNGHFICSVSKGSCHVVCQDGSVSGSAAPPGGIVTCVNGAWLPTENVATRRGLTCVEVKPFLLRDRLHVDARICEQGLVTAFTKSSLEDSVQSYINAERPLGIVGDVNVTGCGVSTEDDPGILHIVITLTAKYTNISHSQALEDSLNTILSRVSDGLKNGDIHVEIGSMDGIHAAPPVALVVNNEDASDGQCPAGQAALQDVGCVSCPSGTYEASQRCTQCPVDTYQDTQGSVACKNCPSGTTALEGSFRLEECTVRTTTRQTTPTTPSTPIFTDDINLSPSPTQLTTTTTTTTTTTPTTSPTTPTTPTTTTTATTTTATSTITTTTSTTTASTIASTTSTTLTGGVSPQTTPTTTTTPRPNTTVPVRTTPPSSPQPNTTKATSDATRKDKTVPTKGSTDKKPIAKGSTVKSPTAKSQESKGGQEVPVGLIVGILVAIVVIVALAVIAFVLYKRYRARGEIPMTPLNYTRTGGTCFDNAGYNQMLINDKEDEI